MITDTGLLPITHVGYSVPDIAAAAHWFVSTVGAGPFFLLSESEYDHLSHRGERATLEHRLAFGQWGPVAIELQYISAAAPERVARAFRRGGGAVNHVSYLADDLAAEAKRLEGLDMPQLLSARSGPVELSFHEAPVLGHMVEVQQRNDFMVEFFSMVQDAADGWDGTDVIRNA